MGRGGEGLVRPRDGVGGCALLGPVCSWPCLLTWGGCGLIDQVAAAVGTGYSDMCGCKKCSDGARAKPKPRTKPPRAGPRPKAVGGQEIGGLYAGWVLISMKGEGTEPVNAGVAGNARERAQDLDDVCSSQRVSACVHTAVANACTLCR
jgi:hypothetical protein